MMIRAIESQRKAEVFAFAVRILDAKRHAQILYGHLLAHLLLVSHHAQRTEVVKDGLVTVYLLSMGSESVFGVQ